MLFDNLMKETQKSRINSAVSMRNRRADDSNIIGKAMKDIKQRNARISSKMEVAESEYEWGDLDSMVGK